MTSTSPRIYIIRGSRPPVCGRETARVGDTLTLNISEPGWPFPRFEQHRRADLVFAGGPAEHEADTHPSPEKR